MSEHLHHKLAVLRENLLHGRLPRNLHWSDAVELVEHLGEVHPHGGEEYMFVLGSHREIFKRPQSHDLGVDEVSRLRKLLKESDPAPTSAADRPSSASAARRMVVVIDHRAAHVYQDYDRSGVRDGVTKEPYDPHGFHRHLIHRKEAHYQGDRVPEDPAFYQGVAKLLEPATQIVLIGHGVGKSSAVEHLVEYLKRHAPGVAQHIAAVETADLSSLTEPETDAIARRHLSIPGDPAPQGPPS